MKKQKKKNWTLPRHKVITALLRYPLSLYCRLVYGLRLPRKNERIRQQSLILLNHQTPFDQFFVGMYCAKPVYYMATEDIFSNGWVSKLIKWLVAPIPIKKQTTDIQAVKNCIKVAKEGGTIAIAPEGNRTYNGKTLYMSPAIASLAKKLNLPVALFRIEGGYGVQPRWSDVVRKGSMRAYVSRVIEPEEYAQLSNEELYQQIKEGLDVNEASVSGSFVHQKSAEYLERAMYVCPDCGLSTFESHDDVIQCKTCGRQIRYLPTKELQGVGKPFPFRFVADWYDYQCDFVNGLDTRKLCGVPLYREQIRLSEVVVYKRKNVLRRNAELALYGDRMTVDDELVFPFGEVSAVTVLGKNKLNVYHGKTVYQIKGDKRFNALKYVNLFYRWKNITGGNENGKFLGI